MVVSVLSPKDNNEYIGIFTSKNTSKRIKISELEKMSRAKKGSTIIKKVKSTQYDIIKAFVLDVHNIVGMKIDGEMKGIKASEIPIMDFASTGSLLSKKNIDDIFCLSEIEEIKIDENEEVIPIQKNEENEDGKTQEMTIDDFIEDFKL